MVFKGDFIHVSKTINDEKIFVQLWSNHHLSDSTEPQYEDPHHKARVAILASDRLYLLKSRLATIVVYKNLTANTTAVWSDFMLPNAADRARETNPVKLKPSRGNLKTIKLKTQDMTSPSISVSHSIPISIKAPKSYDTKFRDVSITFTEASGKLL